MKRRMILIAFSFVVAASVFAQSDDVPQAVKETFTRQYPNAENVNFQDNPLNAWVNFTLNGDKMKANYTKKGEWKNTEKEWTFAQLPDLVKEGFQKSKYADREVEETKVIYRAGNSVWYRLKVKKGTLQKKLISFNEEGRLVDDTITL